MMPMLLALSFESVLNVLYVALGLGLVIFFHELGHFAVAKWCDVHVERFSIGFGPILFSFKRGETEYALSAIPFGGYVKMLGQDDMDPSQLTTEEIAQDPRSYSAKSVPQRMAIISAGVTMNVLTAVLFFAVAFGSGVETSPSIVGAVQPGMPAWTAGIENGDRITGINGREVKSFSDIMRGVALSTGDVEVEAVRPDGTEYEVLMTPDGRGTRRIIGVAPASSLDVVQVQDPTMPPAFPGTAAAKAKPPLKPRDTIVAVDGEKLKSFGELEDYLARHRDEPVTLTVSRRAEKSDQSETLDVIVPANPFRTLGLWMDIGRITSVKEGSPADEAGIRVDDRITKINGQIPGTDINPLEIPDLLGGLHGQEVEIVVSRPAKGGDPKELTFRLAPLDRPGWTELPTGNDIPLSVPSVGVAFNVIPAILKVEPGSPAAKAKIQKGERVRKVELLPADEKTVDGRGNDKIEIEFGGKTEGNWAFAFWLMQAAPTRDVVLTVSNEKGELRTVKVKPVVAEDWYVPERGLLTQGLSIEMKADGVGHALVLGLQHTRDSIIDIYLTLRNLVAGALSPKELHGPLGIFKVAYVVAEQGMAELLLFLGFLSVNLAVINFLPIPVLDGGHMVFLTWEAVTRKKPSERVLIAATYFGMAFVLGLMMLVLYLDIFVHKIGRG